MYTPSIPEVAPGPIRNSSEFAEILCDLGVRAVSVFDDTGNLLGVARGPGSDVQADLTLRDAGLSRGSGGRLYEPRRCNVPKRPDDDYGTIVLFCTMFDDDDVTVTDLEV